jgi:hypothetical protein
VHVESDCANSYILNRCCSTSTRGSCVRLHLATSPLCCECSSPIRPLEPQRGPRSSFIAAQPRHQPLREDEATWTA